MPSIIGALALALIWLLTLGPLGPRARAIRAEEAVLAPMPDQRISITLGREIVQAVHEYAEAHGGELPSGFGPLKPHMSADGHDLASKYVKYELTFRNTSELVDKDLVATIRSKDGYVLAFWDWSMDSYLFAKDASGAKIWNPETNRFSLLNPLYPLDRNGKPMGTVPLIK